MVLPFEHCRSFRTALLLGAVAVWFAAQSRGDAPAHDYPTAARVEYVQECMSRHGGSLATLYQCSCVIDQMAQHLSYDDFVEASTFARNATLGGEGGGIFRDPPRARERAKLFRSLESDAYRACGLKAAPSPSR
jgi:hypothetical protein